MNLAGKIKTLQKPLTNQKMFLAMSKKSKFIKSLPAINKAIEETLSKLNIMDEIAKVSNLENVK